MQIHLIHWFGVLLDKLRGVFCCYLLRTPWSLFQFKETARLLHSTAAGKQGNVLFCCQSSSHLWCNFRWSFIMLLQTPASTGPPSPTGSVEQRVKTRSAWLKVTPHTGKKWACYMHKLDVLDSAERFDLVLQCGIINAESLNGKTSMQVKWLLIWPPWMGSQFTINYFRFYNLFLVMKWILCSVINLWTSYIQRALWLKSCSSVTLWGLVCTHNRALQFSAS